MIGICGQRQWLNRLGKKGHIQAIAAKSIPQGLKPSLI
jgi:hypothetical protein